MTLPKRLIIFCIITISISSCRSPSNLRIFPSVSPTSGIYPTSPPLPTATNTQMVITSTDTPPSVVHPTETSFQTATNTFPKELARWPLDSLSHVAWSQDGTQLAAGSISAGVGFYNPETLQQVQLIKNKTSIDNIVFSPDGRVLAYSFIDKPKLVWDVASGNELKLVKVDMNSLWSGAFSPDGRLLSSHSLDSTIQIWDLANGRELRRLNGYRVNLVVFSPDSTLLATVTIDGTMKIWDVDSGKQLHSWKGEPYRVWNLTFSPDGKLLASASMEGPILLWDVESGKELKPLIGHTDLANCAVFSPDGKMLASGSRDKTVKLWDVVSGSELQTLKNPYEVYDLAFSPDGKLLAVSSFEYPKGMVQLWRLQP